MQTPGYKETARLQLLLKCRTAVQAGQQGYDQQGSIVGGKIGEIAHHWCVVEISRDIEQSIKSLVEHQGDP